MGRSGWEQSGSLTLPGPSGMAGEAGPAARIHRYRQGELKLVLVGHTEAPLLAGVPRAIAALPQCAGQRQMDVFVEEKPQLHAALAATEGDCFTCLRQ